MFRILYEERAPFYIVKRWNISKKNTIDAKLMKMKDSTKNFIVDVYFTFLRIYPTIYQLGTFH